MWQHKWIQNKWWWWFFFYLWNNYSQLQLIVGARLRNFIMFEVKINGNRAASIAILYKIHNKQLFSIWIFFFFSIFHFNGKTIYNRDNNKLHAMKDVWTMDWYINAVFLISFCSSIPFFVVVVFCSLNFDSTYHQFSCSRKKKKPWKIPCRNDLQLWNIVLKIG